jgi:hypothetical protein
MKNCYGQIRGGSNLVDLVDLMIWKFGDLEMKRSITMAEDFTISQLLFLIAF